MFWVAPDFWDFVLLLTPFYLFGLVDYCQWQFTNKYAVEKAEHRWLPSLLTASFMTPKKWGMQIIWIMLMLLPLPGGSGIG